MDTEVSRIDRDEVKRRAAGYWDCILAKLAPSISRALEKPGKIHCDCPIHGGKRDFRVFRDVADTGGGVCTCGTWPDGFSLLMAINGWSFREALTEVHRVVGGDLPSLPPRRAVVRKVDTAREDAAIAQRLNAIWKGCKLLTDPAADSVWRYLVGRGLQFDPLNTDVRCHPALAYHDEEGKFVGHFPGMVAMVRSATGQPVTLHRTYLTPSGSKAPVEKAKKLCSIPSNRVFSGAAIRLCEPGTELGIAEGIETALAVTSLTGIPCWSSINAGGMEKFVPPEGVERVVIYGDKDVSGRGEKAAGVLIERLWAEGIQAGIEIPPLPIPEGCKGLDWADMLKLAAGG